jgi:hypothetical protein
MLLAMVDDIRVILVKLADRLHNMRTLNHLPEDRRIKIAQETRDIYAPIANRLGMSKVKNELEELSFRYLEPQAYEALRISVDAKRRASEGLIDALEDFATPATRAGMREQHPPSIAFQTHERLVKNHLDLIILRLLSQSPGGDTRSTWRSGTGSKSTSAPERSIHCSTRWRKRATCKRFGKLRVGEEEKSTRLQPEAKNS